MTRSGRRGRRPAFERLEGRAVPAGLGFVSGLGLVATGSDPSIHADAVATDPAGDVYVTGSFRGTVAFDPHSTANTITTAGTQDVFVAEYSASGSLDWVRTFAGRATPGAGGGTTLAVGQGAAIAVDASGNVFVAGSFTGTIGVAGLAGTTLETSVASATEAFVAKLDPSGNLAWFDHAAGTAYDTDSADALALDGSGGVVLAGSFADSATFGTVTLSASGSSDAFVARVNGSGAFLWAVASRGNNGSNAGVAGLAVDGSGDVDLAGSFSGTVDFDPSSGTAPLTSAGSVDALLWKLDANGHLLWAHSYGSADYDAATAVAVDAAGDLYATGAFSDTVSFGPASRPDSLTAGPVFDAFLLKVAPDGSEAWAKGLLGASGSSKGQGVAVDPWGDVHVAGTFSGPLDFDPGPGTDLLTSVGSSDAFLAGYDVNGNLLYALQAGRTNFNAALGVVVGASGIASIAGNYSGAIAFGPSTLPSPPSNLEGGFVAQAAIPSPPPAPSAPALEASSDTGISQTDGITADTTPVLDVDGAVAGDAVELLRNGVVVAHRVGPGALPDPGPLPDGTYRYTALQVSPQGLVGPTGAACSVTILTAPPAPLPAPAVLAADDTGVLGDGITAVNQPRLILLAKGGTTVQLLNAAGSVIGSTNQAADGTCVLAPSQPLADGVYAIRARAVDVAGNLGVPGPALTLTIDSKAPAPPSALALLPLDDSGTPGDGLTNVRQPRLTGSAEPGSLVTLVDAKGNLDGSTTAAGDGTFTVKLNAPLADGAYSLAARATDAAGNQGALGPAFSLTILATPPAAPSASTLLPLDDSGTPGDGLTNVRQPRLAGSSGPNLSIQLLGPTGSVLALAISGANGAYLAQVLVPLADGTYPIRAVATDAAGNVSPPGPAFSLTILTKAPASPSAPTLLGSDDSGTVGDGITNVRQARLTGTSAAGLLVRLVNSTTGAVLGTATASGGGSVTVAPSSPLADGTYSLALVAVDAAGNASPAGPSTSLTILATPPPKPAAPGLLAADDTGISGDGQTSVRRPRVVGVAAPGGRVDWLAANGSVVASATASPGGSYQFQLPFALPNGVYPIAVRETDVAGNVSPISSTFNLGVRFDPGDDFGDGITDVAVFRLADATFLVQQPTTGVLVTQQFGPPGSVPVEGDFFGDGRNDFAVYVPSTATFYALDPATHAFKAQPLGQSGDVPVPADYDGDGLTDFAVYRPSTSTFYIYDPISGASRVATVGAPNSIPVPADYEGIGHADPAVFQMGTESYVILMSATNQPSTRQFGAPGDIPVPGDYVANGRADLAVYRPSTSTFYAFDPTSGASKVLTWGTPTATRPPLEPITSWFTFGNAGGPGGGVMATAMIFIPTTPDGMATAASSPGTARKAGWAAPAGGGSG